MRESRVAEGELSDEALLAGMAVGDQSAAVTFTRRYQRRVFGLAYSMTNDAGVAEDVAQEAMIRVWRHAPVFDPRRGSVTSWVLTITPQPRYRRSASPPCGADGSGRPSPQAP